MMWPYGTGAGWGWMAMGWIMMLAFWLLVIVGVVAVVRWASARGAVGPHAEPPMEILRRRYAAGELTREQFESMRREVT